MNTFFNCAVNAIQNEENELNSLFMKNSRFYTNHHQGVCNLYETTFAYIIFKELLRCEFPFTVFWEYPYPGNKYEHCDLALLNEDKTLDSLIELKIWIRDDDRNIKADIQKLETQTGCKKYILIIGYGGDIDENDGFLLQSNPSLILINKAQLATRYFKYDKKMVEDNNLNIFMYQIKGA
jgi:hypothetical protein